MDFKRSPVVTDGPEYSRLSEGTEQTHWYAEGHTDPAEEREERERARSQRLEEEKRKRESGETWRPRYGKEEERRLMSDGEGGASGGGAKPHDPRDLSPKVMKSKQGDRPSQSRSDQGRERAGSNGNRADDESSTPPSSDVRTSTSSGGAKYVPATSIQDPEGNAGQVGGSRSRSDWPPPRPISCFARFIQFMTSMSAFIILALIFTFALFSYLTLVFWLAPNLHKILQERVTLRPSTFSSPHRHPTIRLEVYFYNVNYSNDAKGKPHIHFEDQGPYTYLVKSSKVDINWNNNSTVSYRVKNTFHFQRNHSVGDQNDVINTMDANMLANLAMMSIGNNTDFHVNLTHGMIRPQTVLDILLGGSAHNTNHTKQSTSPVYNIYTGSEHISRLSKVYTFNQSRADRMWPQKDNHYPLSGTADGDVFSPLLNKDQTLVFLYSQTERNLLLQHEKAVTIKGHKAYRFVLPRQHRDHSTFRENVTDTQLQSISSEDVYLSEDEIETSRRREAFALQYLRRDSPFLVSFLPQSFQASNPNGSKLCKVHLDVHPVSGITMRKRLCHQMSLPVMYPEHKNRAFVMPIMLVNWFYESVPDDLDQVMTSYNMLLIVDTARQTLVPVLCLTVFAVVALILKVSVLHCRSKFRQRSSNN